MPEMLNADQLPLSVNALTYIFRYTSLMNFKSISAQLATLKNRIQIKLGNRANLFKYRVQIKRENLKLFNNVSLLNRLGNATDFVGSAGSHKQWLDTMIDGFNRTIPMIQAIVTEQVSLVDVDIWNASETFPENNKSLAMRETFDRHGSDKGTHHKYDIIYANILSRFEDKKFQILEIGLGTNNIDTLSSMGLGGKPGASLRAWAELFPNANITGCDIDSRILFSSNRINTYQLDQTNLDSWNQFRDKIGDKKFELIIDDGLHTALANLVTVKESLKLLTIEGILVIEDVNKNALAVWKLLSQVLYLIWEVKIYKTNASYMVVINKRTH